MRCVLEFRSDGEWARKPIEVKAGEEGGEEGRGRRREEEGGEEGRGRRGGEKREEGIKMGGK